jgi:ketosteroid isomerase-like protein
MSHQNVVIAQGVYEALNRGDLAAMLERIDPDFEGRQRDDAPEGYTPSGCATRCG